MAHVVTNGPSMGQDEATDCARRVRLLSIAILLVLALVAMVMPQIMGRIGSPQPTPTMLYAQDLILLPLFCISVLLFGSGRSEMGTPASLRLTREGLAVAAVVIFAICLWGHELIFQGMDFSRDEQMAVFDAAVFHSGQLVAPIPLAWREIAPALNLQFMLPLGDHAAWVSAYLPINAMMRALVATVIDPLATSPLLVVVGLLALAAIGRQLWPDSPGSQVVALLCYLCSSQVVITGMTAYAVSAHLALNLVWLLLFMRGDRIGFAGTLIVGFLATGAHQPSFHPLFALPFVLGLIWRRQWWSVLGYGIGYTVIVGFWLAWPVWLSGQAGPVPAANDAEGIDYVTRLLHVLALINRGALWTMAANLIRFVTWQHLLLLPLMLLSVAGGRRSPLVLPLAIGIVLPILVMGVLLPWQGHGWGYRYLHPVLGNACLLAGFGWQRVEALRLDLRRPMLWTTVASVVLLPVHGWMTYRMVASQAVPDQKIARMAADIAIVDSAPYGANLVINAPDLSNRPIRLQGWTLRPADIAALCGTRWIAFVDAPQLDSLNVYYNDKPVAAPSPHQRLLHAAARNAGCHVDQGVRSPIAAATAAAMPGQL
ncbi:hypothetical protein [Sphingomonas kyungheensis]|uniref:DUF2079 domain-containing protein n=1 Tax=Sphingomonas kyungheensis TaxID=1069987 RepID=A0ABU8H811_9SPHN